MRRYAKGTADFFGNKISADPDVYGASADIATYITIDNVEHAQTDFVADRALKISVTMRLVGPYKDSIVKGYIELLVNNDGEKYETIASDIDLVAQER